MPDPAEIQRQIEVTRAELAQTIDAIAEIVSPKRVAQRGVEQLKAKVEEMRARSGGGALALDGSGRPALPSGISSQLSHAPVIGTGTTVRWDRVAMVGGAVVVLAVLRRRRRNRLYYAYY